MNEPKEPLNNRRKLAAFTLAEVLITLAIIGVVAALTIPTVVTNYKTKALETQKKKAMSVLSNGFRLLMAQDNVTELKNIKINLCNNVREREECYANEIKRVFNVIADNLSSNDAFDAEYHFQSVHDNIWQSGWAGGRYVFATSDGMIFGINDIYEDQGKVVLTVDVNGIKNPNIGNEDLRRYVIRNDGKVEDISIELDTHCTSNTHAACGSQEDCEAAGGAWTCMMGGSACGCN